MLYDYKYQSTSYVSCQGPVGPSGTSGKDGTDGKGKSNMPFQYSRQYLKFYFNHLKKLKAEIRDFTANMERPAITEIQALLDYLASLANPEFQERLVRKELLALEEHQAQEVPLAVRDHRDRPVVQVSSIISRAEMSSHFVILKTNLNFRFAGCEWNTGRGRAGRSKWNSRKSRSAWSWLNLVRTPHHLLLIA
jgi:hypothetical protein